MPEMKEELKQILKEGLTEIKEKVKEEVKEEVSKVVDEKISGLEERVKKIEEIDFKSIRVSTRGISGKYKGYDLEDQGREFREKGIGVFKDDEQAEEYAKFTIDVVKALLGDFEARKDLVELYRAKGLSEGITSAGGYLVPEEYLRTLIEVGAEATFALQRATIIPMSGDTLKVPKELNKAQVYWTDEGAVISQGDPSFGQVQLNAKKLAGLTEVTNELLSDSAVDIVSILTRQWGNAIAEEIDNQVLNGTGSPFSGVFSEAANVVQMGAGKTGFEDITADDLADMDSLIPSRYGNNLLYVLHRTVFNIVRKLKDSNGNYIVQTPVGNQPGTIWGNAYFKSDVAPALSASGANKAFVALGNFKYLYIGRRKGVGTIDVDKYGKFDTDMTRFRVTSRWAIAVAMPEAFAVLKTAAA